jgi:hypothetical protein
VCLDGKPQPLPFAQALNGRRAGPANGKCILDHFIQITIQASTPSVMIADPRLCQPCAARATLAAGSAGLRRSGGVRNIAFI